MTMFTIHGQFNIPYEKRKGGRTLVFDSFWDGDSAAHYLRNKCGCYVFAIRTGRGLTPIYVGKATKTFGQETFNPTNKHKYQNGFSEYARGLPVIFFVMHPTKKGKKNMKEIAEIEDFLIQAGIVKNPRLENVRGAQRPRWSIQGVVRSGKGKPSKAGADFTRLFDLAHE